VEHLTEDGAVHVDLEDEITAGSVVTHGGEVRHAPTREALGLGPAATPPAPPEDEAESAAEKDAAGEEGDG